MGVLRARATVATPMRAVLQTRVKMTATGQTTIATLSKMGAQDIILALKLCIVNILCMSKVLDEIRKAIEASNETRYQLWKETGIKQSQLSRLMSGQSGVSVKNLERLAEALGLEIIIRRQRKGR
jgi:DNA-binding Xre family transcriptional regulator